MTTEHAQHSTAYSPTRTHIHKLAQASNPVKHATTASQTLECCTIAHIVQTDMLHDITAVAGTSSCWHQHSVHSMTLETGRQQCTHDMHPDTVMSTNLRQGTWPGSRLIKHCGKLNVVPFWHQVLLHTSISSKHNARMGRPPKTPAMTSRSLSLASSGVLTVAAELGLMLVFNWQAYCSRPG